MISILEDRTHNFLFPYVDPVIAIVTKMVSRGNSSPNLAGDFLVVSFLFCKLFMVLGMCPNKIFHQLRKKDFYSLDQYNKVYNALL